MGLTIEQVLQQAVVAHKNGKLHEAERFYNAILKSQPRHPDANHNLGVMAVAVGSPLEAIPFFKLAKKHMVGFMAKAVSPQFITV